MDVDMATMGAYTAPNAGAIPSLKPLTFSIRFVRRVALPQHEGDSMTTAQRILRVASLAVIAAGALVILPQETHAAEEVAPQQVRCVWWAWSFYHECVGPGPIQPDPEQPE